MTKETDVKWSEFYGLEVWAGSEFVTRFGVKTKRVIAKDFERSSIRDVPGVTLRMVRYGESGPDRKLEKMTVKEWPNVKLRDAAPTTLTNTDHAQES